MGAELTRREAMIAGAAAAIGHNAKGGEVVEAEQGAQTEVASPEPSRSAEIDATTIEHAQKLIGIEFTSEEREGIASEMASTVEGYARRRTETLPNGLAPSTVFSARAAAGRSVGARPSGVVRSADLGRELPSNEEDIAFAPVTAISRWIERGELSSERLTRIYLDRIGTHDAKLESVVTVTEDLALDQARRADAEIRAGRYRGPLHGLPWGAKDLFDTAGIRTSWGATPYKDRVPETDASVVRRLEEAGAVLIAKTTLGALAYGDIWFDGKTKNPWDLSQGSSGSSAGSASGTAAGLFAFSLGTETLGSIVSPSTRCGTTGLRPTFGRVSRTGAMALCWSLDKVGPICRTVEDCALVLDAIHGADPGDPSSVDEPYAFDANADLGEITVGIVPAWFEGRGATDTDRDALDALRATGVKVVEIEMPEFDPSPMLKILFVEAAAAFEELTLTDRDDELVWQEPQAWPNTFRQAWFTPAIELVQADRIRRRICRVMDGVFEFANWLSSKGIMHRIVAMSASTRSIIHIDCTNVDLREFISFMAKRGWRPQKEAMHLSPDGDEHDWTFSDRDSLAEVVGRLDTRRTTAGIVLWNAAPHEQESASFIICWPRNEVHVHWGAGCPRDVEWSRAVDCGWIMSKIREVVQLFPERPSGVDISMDAP